MITRRTFLSSAMSLAAAAAPLFFGAESVSGAPTGSSTARLGRGLLAANMPSTNGHYRPPYRFGLGGVATGTGFNPTTDAQAQETMEATWAGGVRYFDTSPWYGWA
jgi:D-threo-aldose 1-dehydrogenase